MGGWGGGFGRMGGSSSRKEKSMGVGGVDILEKGNEFSSKTT
jgi:hypothetical protein